MKLIQEYVRENDDIHEGANSYQFRIIKGKLKYLYSFYGAYNEIENFEPIYDNMICNKLPKGMKITKFNSSGERI